MSPARLAPPSTWHAPVISKIRPKGLKIRNQNKDHHRARKTSLEESQPAQESRKEIEEAVAIAEGVRQTFGKESATA
jgi:hypothetical protein